MPSPAIPHGLTLPPNGGRIRRLLPLAALAVLAACGRAPAALTNASNDAAPGAQGEYLPAPEVTGAAVAAGRQLALTGTAAPGAAVRLASPGGGAQFATADTDGGWTILVPPSATPRLFSLSMSQGGPVLQAMGYIFVAPDGRVARLRAGGGTEALAPGRQGLTALALDYDIQRDPVLSGLAAPGEALSLRVDGVERGQAVADKTGRFTLSLNKPLDPGAHAFDLTSASGETQLQVGIDAPATLASGPFSSTRQGHAWRIDWLSPGGGEQTTLVFDTPGPSA
jgi:hypothetical protein